MTKIINVGNIKIGGENPISIQSMTNTPTCDVIKTLNQINALQVAGCDIVRLAVSNDQDLEVCGLILKQVKIPLVADIQFDYNLAIKCSDIGFHKVRFNPGNIGSQIKVKELVSACKSNKTPIRIGVNSGSLDKQILDKYGDTADALVASAMENITVLEKCNFYDTIISVKSSKVKIMVEAYRKLNKLCDYPLHIGVTESGSYENGIIKSGIGIGTLLIDNIGDTMRVSLTGDPVQEVRAAKKILQAVGLDENYCEIISCPTCSRCKYDLLDLVEKVSKLTANIHKRMKIAVMGCIVNGPGEARDADIGIACGDEKAIIFKKGKIVKTIKMEQAYDELKQMIEEIKCQN